MPFKHINGLKIFYFENLLKHGVSHGIFSRRGGVSPTPWDSLNVGGTVGDDPERVRLNKENLITALEFAPQNVFEVWQVHSNRVVVADSPCEESPLQKADGIICREPGIPLLMRFADCVPLFLFDPVLRATAVVHAGWKGTALRTARTAVEEMERVFNSRPGDMCACIGPSIGPDHYEVGPDVIESFSGHQQRDIFIDRDGKHFLDLWKANELILQEAGVHDIEIAGVCTACNPGDWYSHRGELGRTGRFGAVIGL